jgi:hypothetical protein
VKREAKVALETFTRAKLSRAEAERLVAQYGGNAQAARAIADRCVDAFGRPVSVDAVRQWIRDARIGNKSILDPAREDLVNQILNVIDEANVPAEAVQIHGSKLRSGYHEVVTRGQKKTTIDPKTGKRVITQGPPDVTRVASKNVVVTLSPKWAEGPLWPVLQPGKPVVVKTTVRPRPKHTGKTIVVLSDMQIGFLRAAYNRDELTPIHDEQAIDVALQIVADLQPDQIGYVGDFLDLPEMSRWLQLKEFVDTTQPAIDAGVRILRQFEAAAGPLAWNEDMTKGNHEQRPTGGYRLPTQFVAGNHDRRLQESAIKNGLAAHRLRPGDEPPESWKDAPTDIERLLRFSELGIEYVGEYPGGEWWITDTCVVRHAPTAKDEYEGTVIAGHTHHVKRETFTQRRRASDRKWTLHEIGCLCSLDKYHDKRSLAATRVPSNKSHHKGWSHSFAVVSVTPDGHVAIEQPEYIDPGRAIFRGREYTTGVMNADRT